MSRLLKDLRELAILSVMIASIIGSKSRNAVFVAVNAMSDEPIHDAKNATWAFMPNASKNSTLFRSSVIKIYFYKK
jgi:hypothetical protein